MDPYAFIGQSIADGFYRGQERRDKKNQMQQDYEQRLKLLQEQQRLENEAPTNEMKLMRMYQQNPEAFQGFRMAMDPMAPQEMALKQAQLGLQQQQFGLNQQSTASEIAYRNSQAEALKNKGGLPNRVQEAQWWATQINPQTGKPYTYQEIQQFLYRPDIMSQMMMGGFGGAAPSAGDSNFGQ